MEFHSKSLARFPRRLSLTRVPGKSAAHPTETFELVFTKVRKGAEPEAADLSMDFCLTPIAVIGQTSLARLPTTLPRHKQAVQVVSEAEVHGSPKPPRLQSVARTASFLISRLQRNIMLGLSP
jgi:hypothetical protein